MPCDNDDDNELYNGLLFYDDDDDELNSLEGGKYRVPSVRGKGGGRQPNPNPPPRPNTEGMSAAEAKNALDRWEKDWRSTKDKARRALAHQVNQGEGSLDDSRSFTGVCDLTMRLMTEVKLHPLQIEHTFPTKNITLLRIAEEANLWGVRIILKRSDTHQIRSVGLQDTFYVVAYFSDSRSEWKITNHEVRHPTCQSHPGIVNFFCSFHRRHNIAKYVKGGSGPYSCMRFYNMLISCKLPQTIDRHKFDHSGDMQVQALRFLNAINDYQQYPAARCDLHIDACMHKRTASLSVEAMNRKGLNAMPALLKFLVPLAIFLSASHLNAFTSSASHCPKRVGCFGYSTYFRMRKSIRSDIDSTRKLCA